MTGAGQGAVVPEFSCDENGRFSVEWCRSNTHVLTVTADDDAQMYFSASHGVGLTSSGRWELGEEPPQSFYYAYQAVVGAALSAYDAKCEELAAAEQDAEDERAQLRRHCGCEFEDVEVAERPRIAICLPHLAVERERDAAVRDAQRYRWLRGQTRATFNADYANEPQLIYTKRSDPFIAGYAARVDAAIDAQLAALAPPTEQQKVEA